MHELMATELNVQARAEEVVAEAERREGEVESQAAEVADGEEGKSGKTYRGRKEEKSQMRWIVAQIPHWGREHLMPPLETTYKN